MPVDKITIELSEPICDCPKKRLSSSIGDHYCIEIKCLICNKTLTIVLSDFRKLTSINFTRKHNLESNVDSEEPKPTARVLPFKKRP